MKSLLSCSLVSAGWVHRSRRHLFSTVKLHSLTEFRSWFDTGLRSSSQHVRQLDLAQNDELKWISPDFLVGILADFTSFRNVQSLSLVGLDLTLFDEYSLTRSLGYLTERLNSLSVKGLTAHPEALLFFICMFPKLDNLKLDYLTMGNCTTPYQHPSVTPRFRGKLALSNIKANGTTMLAPFVDPPLPMAFEDVCVTDCRFETPKPLKDLFAACQETMKKIKVSKIFLGKFLLTGSSHHMSPSYVFDTPQTIYLNFHLSIYPHARAWRRCGSASSNLGNQVIGSSQSSKPSPQTESRRLHSIPISLPQSQTLTPGSTFKVGPGWMRCS